MTLSNRLNRSATIIVAIFAFGMSSQAFSDEALDTGAPVIRILKQSQLSADNNIDILIREHLYQPGWKAPTHFHNSDLFIYVISGSFELTTEKDGTVVYESGQAVIMEANLVMNARNPSSTEPLKLAVFQVGDADKPFSVRVK